MGSKGFDGEDSRGISSQRHSKDLQSPFPSVSFSFLASTGPKGSACDAPPVGPGSGRGDGAGLRSRK